MLKPDKNDPLKNRRSLAMMAAFNGFFIFPILIAIGSCILKISDTLCESLLHYMGVTIITPVVGYLYAAHKKDRQNDVNHS